MTSASPFQTRTDYGDWPHKINVTEINFIAFPLDFNVKFTPTRIGSMNYNFTSRISNRPSQLDIPTNSAGGRSERSDAGIFVLT